MRSFFSYGDIDAVKQLYGRIAGNVVRTVASQYSTFQFFDQLDQISSAMLSSLQGEILQQVIRRCAAERLFWGGLCADARASCVLLLLLPGTLAGRQRRICAALECRHPA
jgi:hypothetical protein